jgi:D-tyrosyl-tRNA(Tyr) deacylase
MNRSVAEAGGAMLVVSQFTLYGDCRKGRRPSFDSAAAPEDARKLYEYYVDVTRRTGLRVETGIFQADMAVSLLNDGPVTLIVESPSRSDPSRSDQ